MPPKGKGKAGSKKAKKEASNPQTEGGAKFSWALDSDNKRVLRLSCNDAKLWSVFKSALACGSYGCTYKLEADSSKLDLSAIKAEFGYSGVNFEEVVIKMIFLEQEIADKTDKETVRAQFADLQDQLELSSISELRTQNYLGVHGLAPKLYSFSVAMDCHEEAPVKTPETEALDYEARAATGYLQEKLFATLKEIIRYCGRWAEGDVKLNTLYDIDSEENAKRFGQFVAAVTSRKKKPLELLLETLESSSKLIQHIHELGYLHMDIRWHLGNIMVDSTLTNVRAIDFGLAEYFGAPVADSVGEIGFKETRLATSRDGGVPLHMGDTTKTENIWHESIIDPQIQTNLAPDPTKLVLNTPRSINLVVVEEDLRKVYYKTFGTDRTSVNQLFDTTAMVHASILEAMIRFFVTEHYTQKRLNQYLGWLNRFWAIFRPFVDLLDTQPSDDDLLRELSVLFDRMPSEQEERTENIERLKLNMTRIRTPGAFTHVPRLEAHWETLLFVLRAMYKNVEPEASRNARDAITIVTGASSMTQLQQSKPDVFRRLVKSLFPGDSLRRLPYREMFASAYLTYNVFFRFFADRDDQQ